VRSGLQVIDMHGLFIFDLAGNPGLIARFLILLIIFYLSINNQE
jgi:hypothetical protein